MSVNKNQPHVMVLPEDDANRLLAISFHENVALRYRQMFVLPVAGGWRNVLTLFESEHRYEMERNTNRFMVLLIDFDNQSDRFDEAKNVIPAHLADRVFILGVRSEPEDLKATLGPYEIIGEKLAKDCREETDMTWGHNLLQNNASELNRLREHIRPIFFS